MDMHGKILVVLVNDPDFEAGEGDFGGKAMTYYGRWTYKYEEGGAPRRGRACWSSTRPSPPPMAGRRSRTRNTNAMFDIVRQNPRRRASAAGRLDPARPRRPAVRGMPGSTSRR